MGAMALLLPSFGFIRSLRDGFDAPHQNLPLRAAIVSVIFFRCPERLLSAIEYDRNQFSSTRCYW